MNLVNAEGGVVVNWSGRSAKKGIICDAVSSVCNYSRCLKITEKVSFNFASEVSYVYILILQKSIKDAKNGQFDCGQTVLPDRSILIGQKLMENAKSDNFDIFNVF